MHIGIDAYEANIDRRVGIGQYAYQVIKHIYQLDTKNSYTIYLPSQPLLDMPVPRSNWRYIIGQPGSFWTIRQLPQLIKENPIDIIFSPTHYVPWFTKIHKVFSIMDLSYLHFPRLFTTKDYMQLKFMTLYSVKNADKILTISQFSKNEIIKFYKFPEKNIVVTYPGIQKHEIPSSRLATIQKKYNLSQNYILFVGTLQPRKNIKRLVHAFNQLEEKVQLVLIGKKGWFYEPIMETVSQSPKKADILVLDFVSEKDLPAFYEGARCLVLPSLYEGFGLTVAEAMQYGCPVVVSRSSSLPEVAGKAGIYIDPENVTDVAQGLSKALQLKPEARRELVKIGQAHIKQFSWQTCARKTLDVLNTMSS